MHVYAYMVHVGRQIYVYVCVHAYVEAKGQPQLSTSVVGHIIFLKEDLPLNLELTGGLNWVASEFHRFTVSIPCFQAVLGLQVNTHVGSFYVHAGSRNLSLACSMDTLLTEPSI